MERATKRTERAVLRIFFRGEEQRRSILDGAKIVVGRDPGCDVIIDNLSVSSHHFQLIRAEQTHWLQDLKSVNGTIVNKQPVEQHCLHDGDEIVVGKFTLIYENHMAKGKFSDVPPEAAQEEVVKVEETKKAPGATYAIEATQLQEYMSTARRAGNETTASGVHTLAKAQKQVDLNPTKVAIVGGVVVAAVLGLTYVLVVVL